VKYTFGDDDNDDDEFAGLDESDAAEAKKKLAKGDTPTKKRKRGKNNVRRIWSRCSID